MNRTLDQLRYIENYKSWEGSLEVKASVDLFNTEIYSLTTFIDTNHALTTEDLNTIHYVKKHFHEIYTIFLESLLEWQSYGIAYEIYDEQNHSFETIYLKEIEDLHSYVGLPILQILHDHAKDGHSYYSLNFNKHCRISIEHGFTALFHKKELIDLSPSDIDSVISGLQYIEPDCSQWEKGFWRLKPKLENSHYDEPEVIRNMWISGLFD
ncbi:DUF6985 domain-containing protein [Paenibacillus silvae]|jgi:hypothetical protein|uniref:DUF6985 domain-containing protein n=1 Tax=Paenibacillus silvae TaxID=1325358 RepID=UPI003CEA329F